MLRFLLLLMCFSLPAVTGWAQDNGDDTAPAEVAAEDDGEAAESEATDEGDDFDDSGLDEQGFVDEDDDFDPSEEIPTDQAIEFPSDI